MNYLLMRFVITIVLAVSLTTSVMCIAEMVKLLTVKVSGNLLVLDALNCGLSGRTRKRFAMFTTALILAVFAVIAGTVIYGMCFFNVEKTTAPAVLLAASGALLYLETKYSIYVRVLLLCCVANVAAQAETQFRD